MKRTMRFIALLTATVTCAGACAFALSGCSDAEKDLLVSYSFEDTDGSRTLNSANGKKYKIDYVFNEENQANLYKAASNPLLKQGVKGKALYTDGFSVRVVNGDFTMPKKEITMSAWVAPRVFEDLGDYTEEAAGYRRLTTVLGQSSLEIGEGFSFGYGTQGLWGVEFAITNEAGNDVVWGFYDPVNTLPLYEWTHIAVSIDLNEGYLALSYNGKISYETVMSEMAFATFVGSSEQPLYLGYTAAQQDEYGINTQMPAGLIDEVKIYERAFNPAELKSLYADGTQNGVHPALDWKEVAIDPSQYEGDRYRAQYHALPPGVWMNEPHAPFYYNGKYHVFYQHNPAGPRFTGSMMRWGHIVSDDMVHWQYVKDAVVPAGVCSKGVWTGGSVIGPDGTPWLLLTAGSVPGNSGSGQNLAYAHPADPTDPYLIDWVVEDKVAIAQAPDNSQGQVNEFRDSTCWKDEETGTYYLMVSSSNPNAGGAIPTFTSKDMRNWEYRGYLYENGDTENLGIHWECTLMLPVGNEGKFVLMVIPQFSDNSSTSIDTYYWIGTFDKLTCRFIPDAEYADTLRKFDFGDGHFNGQAGFVDGKTGRTVLYGIVQGTDAESTYNSGWAHNFAFPLELSLSADNKLIRKPIAEIETLYGDTLYEMEEASLSANQLNEKIKDIRGDMLRIDAKFTVQGGGDKYSGGIAVRYNPYSTVEKCEQTKIVFGNEGVYIDRTQSSAKPNPNLKGFLSTVWKEVRNEYEVTILLDRSTLEVYVDGVMSFTTRIYPHYGDSDYIKIFEENSALQFTQFTVRSMKGAYGDSVTPAYYGNSGYLKEGAE